VPRRWRNFESGGREYVGVRSLEPRARERLSANRDRLHFRPSFRPIPAAFCRDAATRSGRAKCLNRLKFRAVLAIQRRKATVGSSPPPRTSDPIFCEGGQQAASPGALESLAPAPVGEAHAHLEVGRERKSCQRSRTQARDLDLRPGPAEDLLKKPPTRPCSWRTIDQQVRPMLVSVVVSVGDRKWLKSVKHGRTVAGD
jgi:hypothetical protein